MQIRAPIVHLEQHKWTSVPAQSFNNLSKTFCEKGASYAYPVRLQDLLNEWLLLSAPNSNCNLTCTKHVS